MADSISKEQTKGNKKLYFKSRIKNQLAKGLLLLATFLILWFAGDKTFCFALCFGLFVSSLFCGVGLVAASASFLLSGCFWGFDVFLWCLSGVAGVSLVFIVNKLAKKQGGTKWFWAMLVVGQLFFIFFETGEKWHVLQKVCCALFCIIFAYVCLFAIKSVFVRGLRYKLAYDEKACVYVFVICFAMGLSRIYLFDFSLLRLVAGFCILATLFVFEDNSCLLTAFLLGVGSSFARGILTDLAIFAVWGVVSLCTKKIKPLCVLSMPLADMAIKYFFGVQLVSVADTVALIFGCIVFAVMPKSLLLLLKDKLGANEQAFAVRSIVARTKNTLSRKLYDLSEIFFEMKLSFASMVKGVVPREQAKTVLAREVSEVVCNDCASKNLCWRTHMQRTENAFLNIMEGAMDRGKATVLDLPDDMTKNCKRLNSVLTNTNQAVDRYKHYYIVTTNNDNSRLLISEQLAGVSDIIKNLSAMTKISADFDEEKENELLKRLARVGVLAKEAVIFQQGDEISVTVAVSSADVKKESIGKVVSSICATKMMLLESQTTQNKNWTVMTYVPAPKYDVLFGFACQKKQGSVVSGDTHSFVRIDQQKFLVALCDGMGSGEDAEKVSGRAISLIENFYKAGFDNERILTSVNRLLTLSQDEAFTAVDISVVNLHDGICDFIKIGGTCGYIRSGECVEIVSAGSLPLGVLEEMRPCITKKALCDGDLIIMASDGVTDAFATKEDMAVVIADMTVTNAQQAADDLLKIALDRQGGVAKDDMTVVAMQIFEVVE